jgi:uncharacterized protein YkwD
MADCDHPGCDGDDNLPNTCNFCNGQFCSEHRLPEKHYCVPEKPAPGSSPEFRETDSDSAADTADQRTSTQQHDSGDRASTREHRPSSRNPPTARSPAVETKRPERASDDGAEIGTTLRDSAAQLKFRLAYGLRRARYYVWRTFEIGLTLTKYAALLAIVALAVIGTLGIVEPGLLAPLSDAGLPVSEGGEPSPMGVEQSPVAAGGAGAATTTATQTAEAASADSKRERIENLIHEKVNERREANGLDPLPKDDLLRDIARSHSQEMAQQDYFAHESPSGETYEDRYDQFGYNCRVSTGDGRYATGGENIWMLTTSTDPSAEIVASNAVQGWMESRGHRVNIMRPYWDDMGIGVYVIDTGSGVEIYVTQNFC